MPKKDVTHRSSEYTQAKKRWDRMRAAIGGQEYVKGEIGPYSAKTFLPNPAGGGDYYDDYLSRAVFYEITANTHEGFCGSVFRKSVDIDLPPNLEYLKDNATGDGEGLEQVSKALVSEILEVGHYGILAEVSNDKLGVIKMYPPESILGPPSKDKDGNIIELRLRELREVDDPDSFKLEHKEVIRVVGLDETGYYQDVYDTDDNLIEERVYPEDFNGNTFKFIPFQFVGATSNDSNPDKPPLIGIANINFGHYHNSADHEENLHLSGQGTLFIAGDITNAQFRDANPSGVEMGGRRGHFIGKNGEATLLQLDESSALLKAMEHKESVAVAIGARFIMDRSGQRTAQESLIDESQQNSKLNTLVGNCVDAMVNVLFWCDMITRANPDRDDINYDLNRRFFDTTLTAQEVAGMVMLRSEGIWAKSDVRHRMRTSNWIRGDRTDEEIDEEILSDGE